MVIAKDVGANVLVRRWIKDIAVEDHETFATSRPLPPP